MEIRWPGFTDTTLCFSIVARSTSNRIPSVRFGTVTPSLVTDTMLTLPSDSRLMGTAEESSFVSINVMIIGSSLAYVVFDGDALRVTFPLLQPEQNRAQANTSRQEAV